MEEKTQLADLLDHHLKRANMGEARLATLVNETMGIPAFLHRSTVRNWRTGLSKRVSDWRKLAAVATVLRLDEGETDDLLASGGCPSLQELASTVQESDRHFLSYWENKPKTQNPIQSIPTQPTEAKQSMWGWRQIGLGAALLLGFFALGFWFFQTNRSGNEPDNLLVNASFEEELTGWRTYVKESSFASAEFDVDNQAFRADVLKNSETVWDISFFQQSLFVTEGESYIFRFRVRGEAPNVITADVTRSQDPKISISLNDDARQKIFVTEKWETHTIEFIAQETISLNEGGARVLFELGHSELGQIWFDDIEFFVAE